MAAGHSRSPEGHRLDAWAILALLGVAVAMVTNVQGAPIEGWSTMKPQESNTDLDQPALQWATTMPVSKITRQVNSMVEFYCGVEDKPGHQGYRYHDQVTIAWFKDDRPVEMDNRVKKYSWSLKISGLKVSDSGNYTCVIQSRKQQLLQWKFFLDVHYVSGSAPIFEEFPKNKTVKVGTKAVLPCRSHPDMMGVEMIWVKHHFINGSWGSGPLVHGDPHITIIKDWNLSHHGPLVFEHVAKVDEGWYTCALRNRVGEELQAAYLNVTEPQPNSVEKQASMQLYIIISIVAGLVILLIVIIVSVTVYCYKKRELKMKQYRLYHKNEVISTRLLTRDRRISSRSSTSSFPSVPMSNARLSIPLDEDFEFPRSRLTVQETIGEGAFGVVKKAIAYGISRVPKASLVAVKTIRDDATYQEQMEFMKEVEVMKSVKKMGSHINIVNFLGCCTQKGPLYVIVEYCKNGNLRDYLLTFRSKPNRLFIWPDDLELSITDGDLEDVENTKNRLSQERLLSFTHQIARGMEFLSSNKCIHRDLAARNVLVTENNVLKIADFGLARSGDYYKKKSGGQIPVKWMPPEALFDLKYTEKSDVWSFGIVMWEIFTLGGMPYPTIPHEDLYNKLIDGYRMERPPLAPESLYDTMKQCWNHIPDDRPDFSTLVLILERQLVRVSTGGYVEVLPG